MNPQAREALDAMLGSARLAAGRREQRVRDATDAALRRVLGIADAAICRKIALTPRVLRRIASRLDDAMAQEDEQALGALLANDLPTDPDAVQLVDDGEPAAMGEESPGAAIPDSDRLVHMVAAAVRLSSAGVLLERRDLEGALALHGSEAVDFGLAHRARVPVWMREAAGKREDLHIQLAASSVLALAETLPPGVARETIAQLQRHDPLPLVVEDARTAGVALAQLAVDFIARDPAQQADEPAGRH